MGVLLLSAVSSNTHTAGEHDDLIEHINKLKLELEEAQITRRRRMEYDEIAVQINAFSSRSELEG